MKDFYKIEVLFIVECWTPKHKKKEEKKHIYEYKLPSDLTLLDCEKIINERLYYFMSFNNAEKGYFKILSIGWGLEDE